MIELGHTGIIFPFTLIKPTLIEPMSILGEQSIKFLGI